MALSPLLPTTIVPTSSSSLSLTISLSGSPVLRCVSPTFPPNAPISLACSSRSERASPSACSSTTVVNSRTVWHHALFDDQGGDHGADGGPEDGEIVE